MTPTPTEARDELKALAYGSSLSEYLDKVWARREAENPREAKSTGAWPYRSIKDQPASNVMPLKKVRKS
jgi:hypothetical protein